MEISRGYEPLSKTNVKGLAKVKLEPSEKLSVEEIHQLIACSALKSNDGFLDYKMLLYDDAIRFKKNEDGSTFPEIPFASVVHLVTLPNFPDVCFIQFRRSTYGMYVILRFKSAKYISKLAEFICSWSNANVSETEESAASSSESTPLNNGRSFKGKEKANNQPPVTVHHRNHVVDRPRSKHSRPRRETATKTLKTEGTQTVFKNSVANKSTFVGHSKPVHAKNILPDVVKGVNASPTKRNYPKTSPKKSEKAPRRKRSSSEPSSRTEEMTEDSEMNLQWQSGEYTIIVPTRRDWPPPKNQRKRKTQGSRAPTRPKGVERRVGNIISSSSTSTPSTSSTADLVDMHGREVKTIYPSYMEPGRMSPRSRHNERLLHMLHQPLSL